MNKKIIIAIIILLILGVTGVVFWKVGKKKTNVSVNKPISEQVSQNINVSSVEETEKISNSNTAVLSSEEMLQSLSHALRSGDINTTLKFFNSSSTSEEVLRGLSADGRNRLAAAIDERRLIREKDNSKTYLVPYYSEDGSKRDVEFTVARNTLNEWIIVNW